MKHEPIIIHGDCRQVLATLPESSVDSIVTDPPYELGFMGKGWDKSGVANDPEMWRQALRVLKPGGHLLAFSGTRTYHRMVCAIEDAGFEIRDQIGWAYGSGFPKSRNISADMAPEDAAPWDGWGTALKPAWEPIVVARKPLVGTVAANVLAHGTGALNIDGCRVPTDEKLGGGAEKATTADQKGNDGWTRPWMDDEAARDAHAARVRDNVARAEALGRWPANLIHDGSDEVLAAFPQAPGQLAKASTSDTQRAGQNVYGAMARGSTGAAPRIDLDKSAARFFYCAKASKADRGEGNTHPTVKPIKLMRYLCRLVTPPGGHVLDPFLGSGSTGKAATLEGFQFTGIERALEYIPIARVRIDAAHAAGDHHDQDH